MAEEKQEGQKTVVSFVVGLLIGGLLVWAFSGSSNEVKKTDDTAKDATSSVVTNTNDSGDSKTNEDNKANETKKEEVKSILPVGDGKITVSDQNAGASIVMENATYPIKEGWVGVRDYSDGQLGALLGVVRFSEKDGLVPKTIELQRATKAGNEYAVVIYQENSDHEFNLAEDAQVDKIFSTFKAK